MKPSILLPAVLTLALLSACSSVPYTGRTQYVLPSPESEAALASKTWNSAVKSEKLSSDANAVSRVKAIAAKIESAAAEKAPKRDYRLFDSPVLNAFWISSGRFAASAGLLEALGDDSMLAAAAAHMAGHALARHGAERILNSPVHAFSLAMIDNGADAEASAAAFGVAAQYGVIYPYTADQELEACRIGMVLLARAGYDPAVMLKFRSLCAKNADSSDPDAEGFWKMHPVSAEETAQLQNYLPDAKKFAPKLK